MDSETEHERALRAEQSARIGAERLAARLTQLQALTAALSRSSCLDDVVQATLAYGPPVLGAVAAALYLYGADRTTLDQVGQIGLHGAMTESHRSLDADRDGPVPTAARTGQPAWIEGLDEMLARSQVVGSVAGAAGIHSLAVLPLQAGGRVLGAQIVGFHGQRRLSDEERSFALTAADLCGQALDRARAYEAVAAARAAAEAANVAKDEFLSTLSHELRTPLTSILGWANILRTRELEPAARVRALATIERNARTQVQLIEDILDVSRIVAGKLRISIRPVDPAAIVRAALEVVRPTAEAKHLLVEAVIDDAVGTLAADPERLQQIAWNLLANAVKFTPHGGTIEVRLERDGEQVRLQVIDCGEGIEARFLPHVFERFRQADASNTRSHGGLGLGLAIVKHLVELHHGTITARSAGAGRGATFTVTLPAPSPSDSDAALARRGEPVTPASVRLDGVRVVLVDDEPDARELLASILQDHGASVTTAACAGEALRAVQLSRPDVLVSDIGMPHEDGYTLLQKVRALPGQGERGVAALALTAYAGREDARRAEAAGFQRHLAKPVLPGRLIDEVAWLAGRSGVS